MDEMDYITLRQEKRQSWMRGFATGLACVVLASGLAYWAHLRREENRRSGFLLNLHLSGDQFLQFVDDQEFGDAYGLTSPLWQRLQTKDEFQRYLESMAALLGPRQSLRFIGLRFNNAARGRRAMLSYKAVHDNDTATIYLDMVIGETGWLVEGINIDSPKINAAGDSNALF
jgi:hypothetical protein